MAWQGGEAAHDFDHRLLTQWSKSVVAPLGAVFFSRLVLILPLTIEDATTLESAQDRIHRPIRQPGGVHDVEAVPMPSADREQDRCGRVRQAEESSHFVPHIEF